MTIYLSEARLAGSKKKVLVRGLAAMVAPVSLLAGPVEPAHAAFPGQNGRIAFTSNRDGNSEIYTMNPDGSDQKRLTFNSSSGLDSDGDPTLSPDGKKIAFTRGVAS